MSNRRADDDTQPLAPRRPLSPTGASPTSASAARPQDTQPAPATEAAQDQSSGSTAARPPGQPSAPAPIATQPVARPMSQPSAETAGRTPPAVRPGGRKARLRIVRLDPWSVMKMAFALSMALAIVTVVAVAVVWLVLSAAGVWDAINDSISAIFDGDTNGFDVTNYVALDRIVGIALVISALNVVLITTLATLAAFLYNLAASLLGGLEVTLAEDR